MKNTVKFNKDYPDITVSNQIFEKASKIMHPVTQTLAKGPTQYINGTAPKYLKKGKGAHVWDVDGNKYLDFNSGIGPISLGYAYDRIDNAIIKQLKEGITFSLMHELEYEVCALINQVIPNAESVRISKTGGDVCSAAIRIARAFTGRNKVLCCGYHGWHDWYITTTSRRKGIPYMNSEYTSTFAYNDIESVRSQLDADTACLIMEPFVFDEPKDNFLEEVQALCKENGTLLIFDEMWTGFRVALGGAQEFFGIKPDLAVYSKAVANGMPIAFLTGRADVMQLFEEEVFFFTTFGGETLSMVATIETIKEMQEKDVHNHIAKIGKQLKDGYNAIAKELGMDKWTMCKGFDCRTIMTWDASAGNGLHLKSLMQQEMIKRGILWCGFHNVNFSHTQEDVDYTLETYRAVLPIMKAAIEAGTVEEQLRGKPVEAVFRKVDFRKKV